MSDYESTDPIKLYLDDDQEPFKVAHPPLTYQFNTIALGDGEHRLRIEASNGLAPPTIKEIPFTVRNGVAVTISGLEEGQTIAGQVQMVINAYAGNTEVDFEPARAETPQPIPTWAWVIFLGVVAWTMFYIINPTVGRSDIDPTLDSAAGHVGLRVWGDTCARCHGEDGRGQRPKVPPVRDSLLALADSPAPLLIKIVASSEGSMMPAWGTRLTDMEIIHVVNHVRHSWGHDSSEIALAHRKPPAGIDALNVAFADALRRTDIGALKNCCIPPGQIEPRLFRTDGVDVTGGADVVNVWNNYFDALSLEGARVKKLALLDTRYDYEPATVEQDGSVVIATGRIFLEIEDSESGATTTAKGNFIRVYERGSGKWMLVFDFADIPMAIGCTVDGEQLCEPGAEIDIEPVDPEDVPPPPPTGDVIGYATVQQYLRDLNKGASSSPHGDFWELSYTKFVDGWFDWDWMPGERVYYIEKGNSARSNLIRALRGEGPLFVTLEDGSIREEAVERMPKNNNGRYMPDERIAEIAAWIDAGAPEQGRGASDPGGAPAAGPGPGVPRDPAPGAVDGTQIGYAQIQEILGGIRNTASSAPHETFWNKPYQEFVDFEFEEWDTGGFVKVLIPYDGANSNLVKSLKDGKGILVRMRDGRTQLVDMRRMPLSAQRFATDEEVAIIEAWIDAGAPEHAGQPSTLPRPEGDVMVPVPGDPMAPDEPEDPPAAPPGFPPAGGG